MIITVASFKGGIGKSTTAVHLSACLQSDKQTLLVDGDPNRSALSWSNRGNFPFKVVDERVAHRHAGDYRDGHLIFDTKARPERDDLIALAEGCDLLIIPTTPDALALEALMLMLEMLAERNISHHRVLMTKVPPPPRTVGKEARKALTDEGIPLFETHIRLYAAFEKAADQGLLVNEVKDDANAKVGWADYVAVGNEVLR